MQTSTLSTFARSFTSVFLAALLSVAIAPGEVLAQQQSQEGEEAVVTAQGNVAYSAAIPTGEFDDALGRTSNGINLYLGVKAGSLPLYVGVDFDAGQYGSEEVTDTQFTGGTFETTSNFYQPQLSLRYQKESGFFRPFVEGLVGVNVLSTTTTFTVVEQTIDAPQDVDESSVAFSAGGGVGADLQIARVKPIGVLGLTGSVSYIYGTPADVPVVNEPGPGETFEEERVVTIETNTSVIQPEVGIYFRF